MAVVVPTPGEALTETEIAAVARENLPGYKRPKHVVVLEQLPINPAGKVAKGALRDLVTDELARRSAAPSAAEVRA